MKKFIAIAALGVLSLTSCKKDYTCACTFTGGSLDIAIKDAKKKDAEKTCDTATTTYAAVAGKCELK